MKKLIFILASLACLASPPAYSEPPKALPAPSPSPEPLITVTSPSDARARTYYLFPLRIPAYVLRGVTWPLVEALRWIDRRHEKKGFSEPGKTKHFSLMPIFQVGGGEGVGFGAGVEFNDIFHARQIALDYTFFLDIDNRANLLFASKPIDLGGRPLEFDFRVQFRNRREAPFFGIGSDSQKGNQSNYSYNQLTTGVDVDFEAFKNFHLIVPLEFLTADTGSGHSDDHPSAETMFPSSELPGFQERTNYFLTGLTLAHDTRDAKEYPLKGGYRAFSFMRYQGLGNSFSFNQYAIDLRQYFLLSPHRYVLVLRNSWIFQQSTGSGGIPFNLLTSLDHYSPLRGFNVGRFRDDSSVVFNLEYHFPIWSLVDLTSPSHAQQFLDGMIFVDTGRVFHGIKSFSFDDWKYSVGGGLNILFNERNFMRFEGGYGGEGAMLFLTIGGHL